MEFALSRWYSWQLIDDKVKAGCYFSMTVPLNSCLLAMSASVAMAVSCNLHGQSWVKSQYVKRFPTVAAQEAGRVLDHVFRVVACAIPPDPRQSSCAWPRQRRYLLNSFHSRLSLLRCERKMVQQPRACGQIWNAFQSTFSAHLQTMFFGVCFLQAARAWPEEILRKAGPLSSLNLCKFDICHEAVDTMAWLV